MCLEGKGSNVVSNTFDVVLFKYGNTYLHPPILNVLQGGMLNDISQWHNIYTYLVRSLKVENIPYPQTYVAAFTHILLLSAFLPHMLNKR